MSRPSTPSGSSNPFRSLGELAGAALAATLSLSPSTSAQVPCPYPPACCDAVCAIDPFCCDTQWDLICCEEVEQICGIPCGDDPCATTLVTLNTGYDHQTGTALPIGVPDPRWTIVVDQQSGTIEPRPANTILKHPAWANPQPDSQWISGFPNSSQPLNGDYLFKTHFCLRPGIDLCAATLALGFKADDIAFAYLNESVADILSNTAVPFQTAQPFSPGPFTMQSHSLCSIGAIVGKNELIIKVKNTGNVAMGLDLVGNVTTVGAGLAEKPECCDPEGAVQGFKYNDLNGDGIHQANEPLMPGWTINIVGPNGFSQSVVTDALGYYYFAALTPGVYTITETQQSGWSQTAPASGSHVVDITGIQGFTDLNFGNRECGDLDIVTVLCDAEETVPPVIPGQYTVKFKLTNFSGQTVNWLFFPDGNVTPYYVDLNGSPLANGATGTYTVKVDATGDVGCIKVMLANSLLEECCLIEKCFPLPECTCDQVVDWLAFGSFGGTTWNLSVTVQNLASYQLQHFILIPQSPTGMTVTPGIVHLSSPLNPGQSVKINVTVDFPAPPPLGSSFSFLVANHMPNYEECCFKTWTFTFGDFDGDPVAPSPDLNGDGVVDGADVTILLGNWGSPGIGDLDGSGLVDGGDVTILLGAWGGVES